MAASGASLLWFLFVLALIPASLWLLKRSGLANGLGAGLAGAAVAAPMKTVGQLNLGPGQRLVTVEVGQGDARTWLVLGVTAQGIQTLHTMAPQAAAELANPTPAVHPAFATLLRRTRQGDQ
jgi:flagellar protein FliO/FliZ